MLYRAEGVGKSESNNAVMIQAGYDSVVVRQHWSCNAVSQRE